MIALDDTGLVCPGCKQAAVAVSLRQLQDGTAQCWGVCKACGRRLKGGALRRPLAFDAVALVAEQCEMGGWR